MNLNPSLVLAEALGECALGTDGGLLFRRRKRLANVFCFEKLCKEANEIDTPKSPVNLEDPVVLRNLSEPDAGKILYDAFKSAINALTVQETGTTRIEDRIRLKEMRPFRTDYRPYLDTTKSIFNKTVGEPHSGGFELRFAAILEEAPDVQAFAKNYLAIGFKLDYVKANSDLANYTPDFIVRTGDRMVWLVETKGRAELDLPQKTSRLKQWCEDATAAEEDGQRYDFVFVDQNGFEKHAPKSFAVLAASFTEYKSP
ncbi:MAG: hypothetical protein HY735_17765 [Verrucomicrobia bacterium]|nr:hypothetical protein [Verrucomicrobiota bacterium]